MAKIEKYELIWEGKKEAKELYRAPCKKELKEIKGEGSGGKSARNLFIEGDNLEALKLLKENYENKIQIIYIDPPYNTGNNFIYDDNIGSHSDWLNMMWPRIASARDLMAEDGVIFVSIDENEGKNLRLIMDEIFGEENFISNLAIENNPKGRKNAVFISESHENCLIYAKNKKYICKLLLNEGKKRFFRDFKVKDEKRRLLSDEYGSFYQSKRQIAGLNKSSAPCEISKPERCYTVYWKKTADFKEEMRLLDEYDFKNDCWFVSDEGKKLLNQGFKRYICANVKTNKPQIPLYTKKTLERMFDKNNLYFKEDGSIYEKERVLAQQARSFWPNKRWGLDLMTETQTQKTEKLFGTKDVFKNSKSVDFIKALIKLYPDDNALVLDFFAGSGTTAQAVMELNFEDRGKRSFILVQIQEALSPEIKSKEAACNFLSSVKKPLNLVEIGKERIRRVGKLTGEVGFRVLQIGN